MVTRYEMVRADDFDSSITRDVEQIEFSLKGEKYTLDLAPKNRRKLERALEPFIDAAKASSTVRAIRSSSSVPATRGSGNPGQPTVAAQIRKWAKDHDINIPARGRIPKEIVAKYEGYEANRQHVG